MEETSYLYRYPTSFDIRQRMCHPAHTNDSIKTEVSVYPAKTKLQGYTRQPLSD